MKDEKKLCKLLKHKERARENNLEILKNINIIKFEVFF